jgi:hypothetical protein
MRLNGAVVASCEHVLSCISIYYTKGHSYIYLHKELSDKDDVVSKYAIVELVRDRTRWGTGACTRGFKRNPHPMYERIRDPKDPSYIALWFVGIT